MAFSLLSFYVDSCSCFVRLYSSTSADSLWDRRRLSCLVNSSAYLLSLSQEAAVESCRILALEILALKLLRMILSYIGVKGFGKDFLILLCFYMN